MALDKLVDSTQLDSDLTSVANAIRTKGGTSAQLAFPTDFVTAINAISGGGGTSIDVETNNIRMVWAEVTVGANTVGRVTDVVPYLLGLAGYPTSGYYGGWFAVKTYDAYFNDMAICSDVTAITNPQEFSKFYRYRNGAPTSTPVAASYDAKLSQGDVYYVGCLYLKGAPT